MSIDLNYLLEMLQTRFSNEIPRKKDVTIDDIRMMQGNREVLDFIKGILEKEERTRNAATKPKSVK